MQSRVREKVREKLSGLGKGWLMVRLGLSALPEMWLVDMLLLQMVMLMMMLMMLLMMVISSMIASMMLSWLLSRMLLILPRLPMRCLLVLSPDWPAL